MGPVGRVGVSGALLRAEGRQGAWGAGGPLVSGGCSPTGLWREWRGEREEDVSVRDAWMGCLPGPGSNLQPWASGDALTTSRGPGET